MPTVGGRGAVQDVINNHVNVPPVDEAETTTIDFGLAEPGRDIFAEKQVDPKSAVRAVEPKEPAAEPLVSSAESSVAAEVSQGTPEENDAEAERARNELFPKVD